MNGRMKIKRGKKLRETKEMKITQRKNRKNRDRRVSLTGGRPRLVPRLLLLLLLRGGRARGVPVRVTDQQLRVGAAGDAG